MRNTALFLFAFFLFSMTLGSCALSGKDSALQEKTLTAEELARYSKATFAGGCFWCVEAAFEKLPGVKAVFSGYTGGKTENPTYEEVSAGGTGHLEAIQVFYDPKEIDYADLVEYFWKQVDPTDDGGQFVDRGSSYRTAIFYHDEEQKKIAAASKEALGKSGRYDQPIVTPILPFSEFYEAEEYHQDYYKKNPFRYKWYRSGSGRDQYLEKIWGEEPEIPQPQPSGGGDGEEYTKPSDEELREMLTPLQYKVTQDDGTERPFDNEYWDNKEEGIYVDVVSGEPLFSSKEKYDSGTGWPSFWEPLAPDNIVEKEDRKLFSVRTEVRSKHGDSHLGHVFPDGPEPTGLRYCLNSAALRFIPKEKLEEEGYGEYVGLFEE